MQDHSESSIVVAATFVAQPLEESLQFWGQELQIPFEVDFAPFDQVFQQLVDPSSLCSRNKRGLNVILIRFEDWYQREETPAETVLRAENRPRIERHVKDLVAAFTAATERSSTPYMLCICPASPAAVGNPDAAAVHRQLEELILSRLESIGTVHVVRSRDIEALYPVSTYYEPHGELLGRVPYTPSFYAALGTMIARKLYSMTSAPHKVIVLDCDQTLWKGVCGEDGPHGITIDPPRARLQAFMVEQIDAGMLLCLCSKNSEEDVFQVFRHHPEMPLHQEHLVSWRINWRPKSENIKSLADELQLGLDSFVFVDDNPVECGEVMAHCPEVVVLQLPADPNEIPSFLEHVWAFDHLKATEEDKRRTDLYRQNIRRERLLERSLTFADFLSGLELEIEISKPTAGQLARVAQLTQRTNQFNFTTKRYSESEVREICQSGTLQCLVAEVRDRFGDYGLVGVMFYDVRTEGIGVDTFLLSCRVLGRGVEYAMLARLGEIASSLGLGRVTVPYTPTKRNQPAHDFLDTVGSGYRDEGDSGFVYSFPAGYAMSSAYIPSPEKPEGVRQGTQSKSKSQTAATSARLSSSESQRFMHIATNLNSASRVLSAIRSQPPGPRPTLSVEYTAPGTELEQAMADIWQEVLGIEEVGVDDSFFELGGDSLRAVLMLAQLERELGVGLSLTTTFQSPTIRALVVEAAPGPMEVQSGVRGLDSQGRGERRRAAIRSRRSAWG